MSPPGIVQKWLAFWVFTKMDLVSNGKLTRDIYRLNLRNDDQDIISFLAADPQEAHEFYYPAGLERSYHGSWKGLFLLIIL
jgi:hypothetical protein